MDNTNNNDIRNLVSKSYSEIVKGKSKACPDDNLSIKGSAEKISEAIGYTLEEMLSAPEDANLGLGCGNPQLIAELKEGETVIDLGSGAGFDCFLASKKVGPKGHVIGIDMTPEMLDRSRSLLLEHGFTNIDFRLGEIENLPVADNTADVIISNCVINLSPQKQRVYDEAYRVLKNGGRIAVSDVVRIKELTEEMKQDEKLYCG